MLVKNWIKRAAGAFGLTINRIATADHLLQARLRELISRLQIDTVIDVGANEGQFSELLSSIGFKGDVVSLEPIRDVYRKLQRSHRKKGWEAYPYACGSQNGTSVLHVAGSGDFSSILDSNRFCLEEFPTARLIRSETVEMRRLDSLLPTIYPNVSERRILLKMDTQGYDHHVFAGAQGILDSVQLIQVEMSVIPLYEGALSLCAAMNLYLSAGFGVSGMFPVSYTKDRFFVIEYDCLLVSRRPGPS